MTLTNLKPAFDMLRTRYSTLNLLPGKLESVGFSGLWTIIRGTGEQSGVAFAFNREHAVYGTVDTAPLLTLRRFVGSSLFELAEHLLVQDALILNSALVATLNALTRPLVLGDGLKAHYGRFVCQPPGEDWMNFIRPDDSVTMIGFGPVGEILGHVERCSVCDMRPASALQTLSVGKSVEYGPKGVRICGPDMTEKVLAESSVVLITGCTLVNGTLEALVRQSTGARIIGIYGWSAAILPEFLAGLGINYIAADQILHVPEFCSAAVGGLETNWMQKNSFSYFLKF